MERREFLRAGMATLAGAACSSGPGADVAKATARRRFRLKYAPHFGMFKHSAGSDLSDQLKFAADQGFVAWQDNGLKDRPVDVQRRIGRTLDRLGMELGLFVASTAVPGPGAPPHDAAYQHVLDDVRASVAIASRVRATCVTLEFSRARNAAGIGFQTGPGMDLLKRCSDILEPHGITLVIESSHGAPVESPLLALDCPALKILCDLGRWSAAGNDLNAALAARYWRIGYVQCADNPGRREPGTGTIDYGRVFRDLAARGYAGVVGMEHGNSRPGAAGERAVIEAYAAIDRA